MTPHDMLPRRAVPGDDARFDILMLLSSWEMQRLGITFFFDFSAR